MNYRAGFVAIVGRPNAGKSTLLNRILGTELSVVTPKAQTTRERVLGILTEERGQIVFIDTPGIHRARPGGINEYMVQEAREALEAPNAVWYLVDPRSSLPHEEPVLTMLREAGAPVFVVMNKSDLLSGPAGEARAAALENVLVGKLRENPRLRVTARRISCRTGSGVQELLNEVWDLIPEETAPYYPDPEQISDRPTRFFVSEKIREQLYLQLGEELPYSCGVEIDRFEESKVPRIEATIYVERDSQKGMVVGKGGAKIRDVGTAARGRIEKFLGQKVFLGLRVKVLKDWTRDPEALKRLGYRAEK